MKPAADSEVFQVRVSRLLLLLLALVGGIFLLAGLDAAVFRSVLDWQVAPGKEIVYYAFLFFCLGIGGAIFLQCFLYFLRPPVMLEFSPEGVSFGTGMRYWPFLIPWRQVRAVELGVDPSLTAVKQLFGGAAVVFRPSPEIPGAKAVSAGIGYFNYRLTLHWFYAGRFPWTIVKTGRRFLEKYGPGQAGR